MKRKWQIVDRFFFMIEFKGDFFLQFPIILYNMGWIRIHMDPELLPLSGFGTRKFKAQSWIRIRNKSLRIHNTCFFCQY